MFDRRITVKDLPSHLAEFVTIQCDGKEVEISFINAASRAVAIGSQQWESGSRTLYYVSALDSNKIVPVRDSRPWPDNMSTLAPMVVPPRGVVLEVTTTGRTSKTSAMLWAHAEDVAAQLEGPDPTKELSFKTKQVLCALANYNSKGREHFRVDFKMPLRVWQLQLEALAQAGLCDKRGALTLAGKNASRKLSNMMVNPYSSESREHSQ